jgi:hypothetical protein
MIYLAGPGSLAVADLIIGNGDFANPVITSVTLLLAFGGMLPAGHNTASRGVYRFRQPAPGGPFARPAVPNGDPGERAHCRW